MIGRRSKQYRVWDSSLLAFLMLYVQMVFLLLEYERGNLVLLVPLHGSSREKMIKIRFGKSRTPKNTMEAEQLTEEETPFERRHLLG